MTNPPDWENDEISGTDHELLLEDKQELKKPSLYKVILHNDDYTTMEFVVFVLQSIFKKSQ
jgi:ATP-dependent Clp protease adaptor protein ClpS